MLIISYDSIGDTEFDRLTQYPAFNALYKQAAVFRGVSTVFLSNTYPVHTSVATGVLPHEHGLISNIEPFPSLKPLWNCDERMIRAKTIWQMAAQKGIKTAAVLWPVTAFSKTIRYNIPEVRPLPGESQIKTSMKAGSPILQIIMFLRYKKIMKGYKQPDLDNFSTACMADILRRKKPGLALMHLTAYDSFCHDHGPRSGELDEALEAMDRNLKILLDTAESYEKDIIVFSDHSQINVHTVIDPNLMLVNEGLLIKTDTGYVQGENSCFFECGGGSAFFHAGKLNAVQVEKLRGKIEQSEGFCRMLTPVEMRESGMDKTAFGFCAKAGYCYEPEGTKKKGHHGYPLDIDNYKVFYMVKGCGLKAGSVSHGGSLLDIAPLVIKYLGL